MSLTGIQFSLLAILFFATSHHAQATCAFSPAMTAQTLTTPLDNRTFSVPPGVPVGQVIAKHIVQLSAADSTPRKVVCSTGPLYFFNRYATLPKVLAPGYTDVYQTSVEGIGVRYLVNWTDNPAYPFNFQLTTLNNYNVTNQGVTFHIEFIKTAQTVIPGPILASSLPTIEQALGLQTSNVVYATVMMSGQFNVTVPTCNIAPASASMTVPMGTHKVSSFSGVGSGTVWKNASIRLTDCPQFYGNAYNQFSSVVFSSGSMTKYTLTANSWSLALSPRNGVVDAANGIMKIDDESGRAAGVGIQLSSSESTTNKINLNNKITQTIVKDGSVTTITIPLYARYIQTENNVLPGKANGRLEYTITYQ